jgi:hypothetical protein
MSKSFTGDHSLAEMTEGQTVQTAPANQNLHAATLQLDSQTQPISTIQTSSREPEPPPSPSRRQTNRTRQRATKRKSLRSTPPHVTKQRFGLPDNFVPRLQRFGRSVLLELNIYRLPNGAEYLPTPPVGTLGSRQHLYALLTVEQYLSQKRGSVYVRNDGRIFDYSIDHRDPAGDIFDTGYTIYELERTGRYAPPLRARRKKREAAKVRSAGMISEEEKRTIHQITRTLTKR